MSQGKEPGHKKDEVTGFLLVQIVFAHFYISLSFSILFLFIWLISLVILKCNDYVFMSRTQDAVVDVSPNSCSFQDCQKYSLNVGGGLGAIYFCICINLSNSWFVFSEPNHLAACGVSVTFAYVRF